LKHADTSFAGTTNRSTKENPLSKKCSGKFKLLYDLETWWSYASCISRQDR